MNTARMLLLEGALALSLLAAPLCAAATDHASAYPEVRSAIGLRLFSPEEIREGERAWLALKGGAHGVLRGYGAGAESHWQADWLRRERAALCDMHAQGLYRQAYTRLSAAEREVVDRKARAEMARDHYDPATNTVTVSVERGEAIAEAGRHYMFLFGDAPSHAPMRARQGIPANALPNSHARRALAGYFFWSAWSTAASRPAHAAQGKPD